MQCQGTTMNKPGLQLHVVLYCSSQLARHARPPRQCVCVWCWTAEATSRRSPHKNCTCAGLALPGCSPRSSHGCGAHSALIALGSRPRRPETRRRPSQLRVAAPRGWLHALAARRSQQPCSGGEGSSPAPPPPPPPLSLLAHAACREHSCYRNSAGCRPTPQPPFSPRRSSHQQ